MTFLPVSELEEGMIVESKVGMPAYLVTKVENGNVTFKNYVDEYTDNDGYVKLINKLLKVTFMRNLDSGIIHATVNGRALCNTRNSQNEETTEHFATCEKCRKLFEVK